MESRKIFPIYRRDYIIKNYNKPDKEKVLTILKALITSENDLEESFDLLKEILLNLTYNNLDNIKIKIKKFLESKI